MIHLLDADLHGVDSIQNFIREGKVVHYMCPTFQAFSQHVNSLIPVLYAELQAGGDPVVIIDTISQLAHTTRSDHKLGINPADDLWKKKDQYMGGDKFSLSVYDYATDVIIRSIKNMRAVEFEDGNGVKHTPRIIVCAHEAEQDDVSVGYKKRAPYLNRALFKSLEANCSDMFRLTSTEEAIPYPDGTLNPDGSAKILYPQDTRFLRLRKSDEAITKFQIEREYVATLPEIIVNPTMRKIFHHLHKRPSFLVIYGPAGVGKTTLAVSEAEPVKQRTTEQKEKSK